MKHRDIALLENCEWLNDLVFLIDMTQMLSDLNLNLQRNDQLVNEMFEHGESTAKLMLMKNKMIDFEDLTSLNIT